MPTLTVHQIYHTSGGVVNKGFGFVVESLWFARVVLFHG